MITINYKNTLNFLKEYELDYLHDFAKYSNELLENKKGAGNDFLGWVNLPSEALKTFKEIDSIGKEIRENASFCFGTVCNFNVFTGIEQQMIVP